MEGVADEVDGLHLGVGHNGAPERVNDFDTAGFGI
jgi:hypothetical protein